MAVLLGPGGSAGGHRHGGHGGHPAVGGGAVRAGPRRARGPKVRRGDVRAAILDVLAPRAARERADQRLPGDPADRRAQRRRLAAQPGLGLPDHPAAQDEGLVEADDERGRRSLRLTAEGERYVAEHADELAGRWAPFGERSGGRGRRRVADLKPEIGQVMGAVWQIVTTGPSGSAARPSRSSSTPAAGCTASSPTASASRTTRTTRTSGHERRPRSGSSDEERERAGRRARRALRPGPARRRPSTPSAWTGCGRRGPAASSPRSSATCPVRGTAAVPGRRACRSVRRSPRGRPPRPWRGAAAGCPPRWSWCSGCCW